MRWLRSRQPLRHVARLGPPSTLAERLLRHASARLCLKCIPSFTIAISYTYISIYRTQYIDIYDLIDISLPSLDICTYVRDKQVCFISCWKFLHISVETCSIFIKSITNFPAGNVMLETSFDTGKKDWQMA